MSLVLTLVPVSFGNVAFRSFPIARSHATEPVAPSDQVSSRVAIPTQVKLGATVVAVTVWRVSGFPWWAPPRAVGELHSPTVGNGERSDK